MIFIRQKNVNYPERNWNSMGQNTKRSWLLTIINKYLKNKIKILIFFILLDINLIEMDVL